MDRAANLQFGRIVEEFVRWREVPDHARSPAPSWWWGPAFEVLGRQNPMPVQWCRDLGLPEGAPYADGARIFLTSLSGQTSPPRPDHFPREPEHSKPS